MVRVLRGVLLGGVVGVVLGSVARGLMRLVALVSETETEFNLGASLAIVSLFVASAAGAGLAGVLGLGSWKLAVVVLLTSGLLFLTGAAFGIGEVGEIYTSGLSRARSIVLTGLVAGIVALVPLTPWVGRRVGRAAR